jgi:DNA polymerase III subunit delta'
MSVGNDVIKKKEYMFSQIIGNNNIKSYLKKILTSDLLANTILFEGPDGVGKSIFAKQCASYLMRSPNDIDEFFSKKLEEENHPDLHVYRPEGKIGMHSIASIRELINQVFMLPFEARAKVFIIHDAERMLPTSANALLKTLEEPTLDSYIFLLTSRDEDILPTILSRCSKVKFSRVSDKDIVDLLVNKTKLTEAEAKNIAVISHGSVAHALELAQLEEHSIREQCLIKILAKDGIFSCFDLLEAISQLDGLYPKEEKNSKEDVNRKDDTAVKWHKNVNVLFSQILMWYRDLHMIKILGRNNTASLFFENYRSLIEKQNLEDIPQLEHVHEVIEEAKVAVNRNIKFKTCMEQLFLSLTS